MMKRLRNVCYIYLPKFCIYVCEARLSISFVFPFTDTLLRTVLLSAIKASNFHAIYPDVSNVILPICPRVEPRFEYKIKKLIRTDSE